VLHFLDECHLGETSSVRLVTCTEPIQLIVRTLIRVVPRERDFSVACGHRGREAQEDAFARKASTKHWPESRHNRYPSPAVDLWPYPVDWDDLARFAYLMGMAGLVARELKAAGEIDVAIDWGGDWNNNGRTKDERLIDMPHLQERE